MPSFGISGDVFRNVLERRSLSLLLAQHVIEWLILKSRTQSFQYGVQVSTEIAHRILLIAVVAALEEHFAGHGELRAIEETLAGLETEVTPSDRLRLR